MEWIEKFKGKTIGIDTAPLIYFIEEHPTYLSILDSFFSNMEKDEFTVSTSTITLLEVLVHPFQEGDISLASEYRDILLNSKIHTLEISCAISEQAAKLRAEHKLRAPDALQISTAIYAGADFFLTNDSRLPHHLFVRNHYS